MVCFMTLKNGQLNEINFCVYSNTENEIIACMLKDCVNALSARKIERKTIT